MQFEDMFPSIESSFDEDDLDKQKQTNQSLETKETDEEDEELLDEESDDTDEEGEESEQSEDDLKVEYERHFNYMKENGYLFLPDDYKFDGDLEKTYEVHFETMQKELADSMVKNIPDEVKALVQYTMQGGKNVQEFMKTYSGDISYNLEDVEDQRTVIKDHLKTKGLSDKTIAKMISTYEVDDELEEMAKESKLALEKERDVKQQNLIKAEKEQELANKQQIKEFTSNVFNVIKEQTWDAKTKKEMYDMIVDSENTNNVFNKLRTVNSNPQHLVQLAQIMKGYDPKKGFDLNKVYGSTTENKQLKNKLESLFNDTKNLKSSKFSKNDSFDWEKVSLFPTE